MSQTRPLVNTLKQEFLDSTFSKPGESRIFASGMISAGANAELIRKIQHLAREMHDANIDSESLPLEKRFGTSLMMAIRPWEIQVFTELRRSGHPRVFANFR
jgi:hypothetical protein